MNSMRGHSLPQMPPHHRLTLEECLAKVAECRDLAKRAASPEHREMLEKMAEMWAELCADLRD